MSMEATKITAPPSAAVMPMKTFGIDTRLVMPLLITLILLVGQAFYGILESYPHTLAAIGVAVFFELVLSKIDRGHFPFLASAYISGISVGILTRSPFMWTFALCSAITITSKYVLKVKGRHLWNPSNFGVAVMLLIAPSAYSTLSFQWGNNLAAMTVIWVLGCIIIYRLKRFHITATYVLSFVFFAAIRSYWTGDVFLAEIAPITGAMYQLFIFFMITDPATTVRHSKRAQIVVVFLIAAAEMVLRMMENVHAPYYALFIVGPAANLVDIYWHEWKEKKQDRQD